MGKEMAKITAKEARKLSDESEFTLKHLYKEIRRFATENRTNIFWSIIDVSRAAVNNVTRCLKACGFDVTEDKECEQLIIKW